MNIGVVLTWFCVDAINETVNEPTVLRRIG